ncbi:enoyl-CoA hydratase/isomerase family protein [Halorientalis marina]|uniref:enoyl-CoA hydratase/isomerase family protein n=1 Tax=Halorientalis marina TaxID=2931976 RepID=UPI001FF659FF|nr:enoyl-CoA hydratase/isomerase family protein [Halorientalis marina]
MATDSDYSTLQTYCNETTAEVFHIDLDRPEDNNVITTELLSELGHAIESADADDDIDAIVLGTSSENFCAGGSLQELGTLDREGGNRFLNRYIDTVNLLRETGKPTLAAVKGNCVAGGNELVMGVDIIVAGESARFGQPEVRVGSTAAGGGVQMLPLVVGQRRAKDLLLTGRLLSAQEAEEWGLINRVVDDGTVDERAVEIAKEIITQHSPQAYRVIKAMLKRWNNLALTNREVERELTAAVWESEEFSDRADAFMGGEDLESRSFSGTLDKDEE